MGVFNTLKQNCRLFHWCEDFTAAMVLFPVYSFVTSCLEMPCFHLTIKTNSFTLKLNLGSTGVTSSSIKLVSFVVLRWRGGYVWAERSDEDCNDAIVVMATAINK